MLHIHKWTKWIDTEVEITYSWTTRVGHGTLQYKRCVKCRKLKTRSVL